MNDETIEFDDPQFEIDFYEGVLRKNATFIEVLSALGDLYTNEGFFQKGLEIDERLEKLRPVDPIILYNLACSYSLLHRIDESFTSIRKAIESGYKDFEFLEEDDDLSNLRHDQRFQDYYTKVKRNRLKDKSSRSIPRD